MSAVIPPPMACRNCHRAWRAAKPRPMGFHCWHVHIVAIFTGERWRLFESVSEVEVATLREGGVL
jgi:hypothetical protein